MARSFLLIVAAAGSPTTGDALIKSTIEGLGHTATYKSASDAEDIGAHEAVVIGESVSSGTAGSKYSTLAVPGLVLEPLVFDDWLFGTTPSTGTSTVIDIVTEHDLAAGLTIAGNPHTVNSAGTIGGLDPAGDAAGLVIVASINGSIIDGYTCIGYVPSGAALTSGNAPALRILLGWTDSMLESIAANGTAILEAAINMIDDELGGPPIPPVTDGPKLVSVRSNIRLN